MVYVTIHPSLLYCLIYLSLGPIGFVTDEVSSDLNVGPIDDLDTRVELANPRDQTAHCQQIIII